MIKVLRQIGHIRFAPVVAILFGIIFATLVLMTPPWLFERGVATSGLPTYLSAAQPPLGETARVLVAVCGGLAVATGLWAILTPISQLIKRRTPAKPRGQRIAPVDVQAAAPSETVTRRFHREPIFADRDLGAPFMSDEAIAPPVLAPEPVLAPVHTPAIETMPLEPRKAPAPPLAARRAARAAAALAPVAERAAPDTVSKLMGRLDSALDRRAAHGVSGMPKTAGDITSLRKALAALK